MRLLRRHRPDLVLGVGGYASGPVLIAAWLLRIPTAIQEQNAEPGVTNRLLGWFVDAVFTAFPETSAFFAQRKVHLLGNPIRRALLDNFLASPPAPSSRFSLLVFGGSQGAHRLNTALLEAVPLLPADRRGQLSILHQTGGADRELVAQGYARLGVEARVLVFIDDMSAAYRGAVATNLRKAKIVFDRFHVVKLFNEKLSDLRRALYHEATDVLHKEVLKGTRWLLLKNRENLDVAKDEKKRLEEALMLNKPLATAYYMKEDLRRFWEQPGKRFATTFLDGWIRRAVASGIRMLQQIAKTLALYRSGLLAYYDVMITSGPMEGTNNKIKTMKRQAYGFRDREFFKLKILAIHETRYELAG